jgi:hypothetical protein
VTALFAALPRFGYSFILIIPTAVGSLLSIRPAFLSDGCGCSLIAASCALCRLVARGQAVVVLALVHRSGNRPHLRKLACDPAYAQSQQRGTVCEPDFVSAGLVLLMSR